MILLLYCLHGDEKKTEVIAQEMMSECPNLEIMLGNPNAHKSNVRYTETDLNRSFHEDTPSYEGCRAQEILHSIGEKKPEIVIDLHTTKAKMPPVAIVTDLSKLTYVSFAGMKKVIYMTEDFSTGGSLIEHVPQAFSVEIHSDAGSVTQAKKYIRNACTQRTRCSSFEVYFVEEIVSGEKDPSIRNFQQLPDGSYPVFSGETSYKNVKYLRTRKEIVDLSKITI